jgi:hypothetical protein
LSIQLDVSFSRPKAGLPLGEFVRANREKSNLIGWRLFLLVRAKKIAKWKTKFT